MNSHTRKGFKTETDMKSYFTELFGEQPEKKPQKVSTVIGKFGVKKERFKLSAWYSDEHHEFTLNHHDGVPPTEVLTCDDLADMWIQHWLSTPKEVNPFMNPGMLKLPGGQYTADANSFVFAGDLSVNANVYFAAVSAFQEPDFRRVIMHQLGAVLVPVYIVIASQALFPSLNNELLMKELIDDLKGIDKEHLAASFDGEPLYGCTVVRSDPLTIKIPKDNIFDLPPERLKDGTSMDIVHAGFWLLIKEEMFTPGDHLLWFRANSSNYEVEAKLLITTLGTNDKIIDMLKNQLKKQNQLSQSFLH